MSLYCSSCKSNHATDLSTKSLPTFTFQKHVHGIGMWRLRKLQESGGVSSWIVPVQSIILYPFSLHEVLIKVFNEVISTWDHMSYFLFSPPGFLGKYIRHIYCPLNSMVRTYWVKGDNNYYICCSIFFLFSYWVWRSFDYISNTYLLTFFPQGFWRRLYQMADTYAIKQWLGGC